MGFSFGLWTFRRKGNALDLRRIETQFLGRPARSLSTMLTELSRFFVISKIIKNICKDKPGYFVVSINDNCFVSRSEEVRSSQASGYKVKE